MIFIIEIHFIRIHFVFIEHVVSVIASLIRNCDGQQRQRLLNKFIENDHEKVERLMELHFHYLEKVQLADDMIEKHKKVCDSVVFLL